MAAITFNTLKYSKTLIEAGMPVKQAEGQTEALAAVIEDHIPTKQDLKDLQLSLALKIDHLENKMLAKLGGLILICTAILSIVVSMHH